MSLSVSFSSHEERTVYLAGDVWRELPLVIHLYVDTPADGRGLRAFCLVFLLLLGLFYRTNSTFLLLKNRRKLKLPIGQLVLGRAGS